jgi:hypothetical protein
MPLTLQVDNSGQVVMRPLTGYALKHVAEIAVLLVIRYADDPEDIETEDRWKQLQIVATPAQALELAESLTRAGKSLLRVDPDAPRQ